MRYHLCISLFGILFVERTLNCSTSMQLIDCDFKGESVTYHSPSFDFLIEGCMVVLLYMSSAVKVIEMMGNANSPTESRMENEQKNDEQETTNQTNQSTDQSNNQSNNQP